MPMPESRHAGTVYPWVPAFATAGSHREPNREPVQPAPEPGTPPGEPLIPPSEPVSPEPEPLGLGISRCQSEIR